MSARIRGVVFDLDGTLIDSMPVVYRAYAFAMEPHAAPLSDEAWLAALGGPPERIFERLLSEPAARRDAQRRFDEFTWTAWHAVQPFAGMAGLLDGLRASGCALALWTGRDRASTEGLLRAHGIGEKFTACVCGDDLPSHKPDPAGLVEALAQLGVPADAALLVGDGDVDVLAGVALGVRTVLITHGRAPAAAVRERAWRVVATAPEAYGMVREAVSGRPPA